MAAHEPTDRPDLAAMVGPLARLLMALEEPVLERHDLTMWAYTVLSSLRGREVRTQSALAEAIGADKTRIISVLDHLQDDRLITRRPDPADRRVYLLCLTERGERARAAAQTEIQRHEEELLGQLNSADRAAFLRALQALAAAPFTVFAPS